MNKEWSAANQAIQAKLKQATFADAISELISLRDTLMTEIDSWRTVLSPEDFSAMPFPNANGYHNKTVAYSLWHIFRIEDIVVNTLIRNQAQILFSGSYQEKLHASLITTGNELAKEQIVAFSRELRIDGLYQYIHDVKNQDDAWLTSLTYQEAKASFSQADKDRLIQTKTVSSDECAAWLIDYWCGKDVKGLLKMPLSRHWIMHVEASLRIIHKLHTQSELEKGATL